LRWEFDPTIVSERVHDGGEYIINDLAGLELCKAKVLRNRSDDVFSGHESILLPRNCEDVAARRYRVV
jgi:hypothetical protein